MYFKIQTWQKKIRIFLQFHTKKVPHFCVKELKMWYWAGFQQTEKYVGCIVSAAMFLWYVYPSNHCMATNCKPTSMTLQPLWLVRHWETKPLLILLGNKLTLVDYIPSFYFDLNSLMTDVFFNLKKLFSNGLIFKELGKKKKLNPVYLFNFSNDL